jgi:hypothetical protein
MCRKVLIPRVKLAAQIAQLLQREIVRFGSRVDLLEHAGENPGGFEQTQSAGNARRLPRKCGLEALFRHILIVGIRRVLRLDVILIQELGQAEDGGGKAETS